MRKEARTHKDTTFTSARTLLAILRLSTALVGDLVAYFNESYNKIFEININNQFYTHYQH